MCLLLYNYAFQKNPLCAISIPDTIRIIGKSAFSECRHLEKVILSNKLEEINEYAFDGCSKLSTVYVPKSYTDPLDSFCGTSVTVTKTSELN